MRRKLVMGLCVVAAFFVLSGCAGRQEQNPTVLPFYDGVFILTPSDFDESRMFAFGFSEGREYTGAYSGVFYEAVGFCLRVADFIDMMNGFAPVLVDSITTDTEREAVRPPFRGINRDHYLYNVMINNVPNWVCALEMDEFSDFHFRMDVYETDEYGLLYFFMFGSKTIWYPTHSHSFMSDIVHHSLYRISLDELSEFIQFAESLERGGVSWTVFPDPYRFVREFIPLAVGIGVLVCIVILLVVVVRKTDAE